MRRFICSFASSLRRLFPGLWYKRSPENVGNPARHESEAELILLPDDYVPNPEDEIETLEYIGWDRPRRYLVIRKEQG